MVTKVERGKDISVLVEQAFPTCILVSFQHGEKTFRGVLLDESSQTVIRASPSDLLGKANNTANLGLTTARATTCQSDLQNLPSGHVNTRSSAMLLRDGREGSAERITPVHKFRGLVESLTLRTRRLGPNPQPDHGNSSAKDQTVQLAETVQPGLQQSAAPNGHEANTTNSIKRKRADPSDEPLLKPAKARNTQTTVDANVILKPNKCEDKVLAMQTKQSSPLAGRSTLFPILKLKKTSGLDNSYVATIRMFNPVEAQAKDVQHATEILECSGDTAEKPSTTSQDKSVHKHNTRFKARKTGTQRCPAQLGSETNLSETRNPAAINNEELIPCVFTEKSSVTCMTTQLNDDDSQKSKNSIIVHGSSKCTRQINPRAVHHSMKVGDIAWGKVHGHPWWPCHVLGILCNASEHDGSYQIVKVSWYASTTTSDISCSFLLTFKEHFKHLFRKQKKGAYQRAVKQAQHDLELSLNGIHVMPA